MSLYDCTSTLIQLTMSLFTSVLLHSTNYREEMTNLFNHVQGHVRNYTELTSLDALVEDWSWSFFFLFASFLHFIDEVYCVQLLTTLPLAYVLVCKAAKGLFKAALSTHGKRCVEADQRCCCGVRFTFTSRLVHKKL